MASSHNLKDRFYTFLSSENLFSPGDHLLVAVSGGMDSMALLHLLASLRETYPLRLTVAHVNHHLRSESQQDEDLVVKTSRQWEVPCLVAHLDPKSKGRGESLEAWARRERYAALEKLRQQCNAQWIVTAHHQKDQAETVLAHLTTGCGISGLQGIHPRLGRIVRPFLSLSRGDIETYCKEHQIPFIDDPTNLLEDHPRNFIRHQVLPSWTEKFPALEQNLGQVAQQAQETEAALNFMVQEYLPEVVSARKEGEIHLEIDALANLPVLLQVRLIKHFVEDQGVSWRRHVYNGLKTFLKQATTGQMFTLPNAWRLLKNRTTFILKQGANTSRPVYTIHPGETLDCEDFYFHWKWVETATLFPQDPWKETIDGTEYQNCTLTLRQWQPGDVFQPLGMTGTKKISDFFTDVKVNRLSKENQWLLIGGEDILWVCGWRISDKVKVTPKTKRPAELSMILKVR